MGAVRETVHEGRGAVAVVLEAGHQARITRFAEVGGRRGAEHLIYGPIYRVASVEQVLPLLLGYFAIAAVVVREGRIVIGCQIIVRCHVVIRRIVVLCQGGIVVRNRLPSADVVLATEPRRKEQNQHRK